MLNTFVQDKAEILKKRAAEITEAMHVVDNSELDLAPETNRISLSNARLPGFLEGTFDGEAVFADDGRIVMAGVRQRIASDTFDVLVRREGPLTRVTERRYAGQSVSLTVTAVFTSAGDLLRYEEFF